MIIRRKMNSVIFFILSTKWAVAGRVDAVGVRFEFEKESVLLLSRFLIIRTVSFRRSKKQSCSTRRGLRVGNDLVEFRQLQEVEIFSYL